MFLICSRVENYGPRVRKKKAEMYWMCCAKPNYVCVRIQLCSMLCDTVDCSPPVSSVHGISQARILGWVAISFCRGSSWNRDRTWVFYFLQWQADSLPLATHLHFTTWWSGFNFLRFTGMKAEGGLDSPRRLHETRSLLKGLEGWGSWRIAGRH